jgi:hypothetical protein
VHCLSLAERNSSQTTFPGDRNIRTTFPLPLCPPRTSKRAAHQPAMPTREVAVDVRPQAADKCLESESRRPGA